jgi:NDP-4-keto-2,6-dideoxyhexose 3-C-methyltransferase
MYTKIKKCRICGNEDLVLVLNLGVQTLTGVFPRFKDDEITKGPLNLLKCSGKGDTCGLLQLEHTYDLSELYGENYGYRSGLNQNMVTHLANKVKKIESLISLSSGDLIIDIGSNDATTLRSYSLSELTLVGVDPTGVKFKKYYPPNIKLIPDFFDSDLIKSAYPTKKAKVVTSFSMFYDLEDPIKFMKDIFDILDSDGIWIFEQSYMPFMLEKNSFDTICHEHLEFYSIKQIQWMCNKVGFKIIDIEFNDVNGGSFSVTVSKESSGFLPNNSVLASIENEKHMKLDDIETYIDFSNRISKLKLDFINFVNTVKLNNQSIAAIGASTKGNVLLQYYNLDVNAISCVGEVNSFKFDCFTPGSLIPIISEDEVLSSRPDYLLILPWHFRSFFLQNEKFKGFKLIFPLPYLEIVENN